MLSKGSVPCQALPSLSDILQAINDTGKSSPSESNHKQAASLGERQVPNPWCEIPQGCVAH